MFASLRNLALLAVTGLVAELAIKKKLLLASSEKKFSVAFGTVQQLVLQLHGGCSQLNVPPRSSL
jgi:hypothetical protein